MTKQRFVTARLLTNRLSGHTLNHRQVLSPDRQWAVFDSRNDDTQIRTTQTIERVHLATGECEVIYRVPFASEHGPGVGAATYHPTRDQVLFIHGLFDCDETRPYGMSRRFGAVVDVEHGSTIRAAEYRTNRGTPPFGALCGGSHAHSWSPNGQRVSFTYNDSREVSLPRTVGFMTPAPSLCDNLRVSEPFLGVDKNDAETFAGLWASFVLPLPSKLQSRGFPSIEPECEIIQGVEECWLSDDTLAFLGTVRMKNDSSKTLQEVFLAKLPTDEALEKKDAIAVMRPERITFLEEGNNPGVQGPRHWLIGDGSGRRVFFLLKDSIGIVQLACVDVLEKQVSVLTELKESVEGQISCDPMGKRISFVSGGTVHLLDLSTGELETWIENRWEDRRGLAVNCPTFQGSYVGSVHFVSEARLLVNRYVGTPSERFLQILQLQAD